MPFNAGAVLRVAVVGDYDNNDDVVNVYQYQLSGASGVSEALAYSDLIDVIEALYAIWLQVCTIRTIFRGIYVSTLDNNIVSGFIPFASPLIGALNSDSTPSGVAFLASLPTGQSRRVLRKYIGPVAESMVSTGGYVAPAALTIMGNGITALLTPQVFSPRTWTYCHVSTPGGTPVIPTSGLASAIPAYQRRRRLGTGS